MNMSFTTKIALAVGAICLIWHIYVATAAKTKLAGLFLAKPGQAGYVWRDVGTSDSRFFWDLADLRWKPGLHHPEFNAMAGEQTGQWVPQPGYVFVDQSIDLTTLWKADELHPDFMAWSDKNEGSWKPVAGYRFTYSNGEISGTVWEPNKRYDDLKITTLVPPDQYKPFAGYQFVEPGKSLTVAWTPGLASTDNPRLMAGTAEGSWVVSDPASPRYRGSSGGGGTRFGRRLRGAAEDGAVNGVRSGVERAVSRLF
jgi:hypothetical protein